MSLQAFHLSPLQRAVSRLRGAGEDIEALFTVQADAGPLLDALRRLVSEHEVFRARLNTLPQTDEWCTEIDDAVDPARMIGSVPMPADWQWTLDGARRLAHATGRARIVVIGPRAGACAVYLHLPRLLWDAGCMAVFARLLEAQLGGTGAGDTAPLQYTDVAQTLNEMPGEPVPAPEVAQPGSIARLQLDTAHVGALLHARAGALGVQAGALALALWTAFVKRSGIVPAAEIGWIADGHGDRELADVLGPLEWCVPWQPAQPRDLTLRSLAVLAESFIRSDACDVSALAGGRRMQAPLQWMQWRGRVAICDLHDPASIARCGLQWISSPQSETAWLVYDAGAITGTAAQLLAASLRQWFIAALNRETDFLENVACHVPALAEWFHGAEPAAPPAHDTIPQRLARLARQFPDRPALVSAQGTLTYDELQRRVLRHAATLVRLGIRRADLVALACTRDQDLYLLMLAVICAGATYVPVDLAQPKARNEAILRDARPRLLIVSDRRQLSGYAADCDCRTLEELASMDAGEAPLPQADERDAAYAIYTSGTTGVPKGVLISHASLIAYADAVTERIEAAPIERFAALASFATDLSYTSVFGALLTGRTFCVMPDAVLLDGCTFARLMREFSVDCLKIVPGHWLALAEQAQAAGAEAPLPCRAIVFGGERLSRTVIDKVRAGAPSLSIFNHYGPTETTIGVVSGRIEPGADERIELGRPLAHVRAYVVNAFGELCLPGVEGELAFAGTAVARCYRDRPAITADRFRPDPHAAQPGARLYLSGDRGYVDEQHRVHFRGRVDDQLKIAGHRVELGEIAAALLAIDGVMAAEAVADPNGTRVVIRAFVRLSRQRAIDDLQQELRSLLPEPLLPATIQEVVNMPLTGSGKVDRAALLALGQMRSASREPRTEMEASLRAQWAELLGIDARLVGVEDDFFRLGGHSLLAARMLARVRLVFGRDVGVGQFFASPTIAGLAALLSSAPLAPDSGLAKDGDPARQVFPLSAGQQRLWATAQLGVSHAYNNSYRMRLIGELDVARLMRSIDLIARRHHVLHARIVLDERDEASMQLCPEERVPIRVVDLTGLPRERREAAAAGLCGAAGVEPFHLDREPPLRVVILRMEAHSSLLLLVVHHVAWDGASGVIFVREAAQLYAAGNAADALRPLPVNYGDYALAQRQWQGSEQFEQSVARWLSRLANLPMLELRGVDYDAARGGEQHGESAVLLAPAVARGLGRLAQRHSATAFMVTLTIYFLALQRHSGQTDIPVGTSVENRGDPRTEGIIGFFVNQLVLRANLGGDPTVDEAVRRVRALCGEAFDDQAVPFNTLVSRVKQPRKIGRAPLYQSMFVFQSAPRSLPFGTGLTIEPLAPPDAHSRFDLSLYLHEQPGGAFAGALIYDRELLGEHRAKAIASDYERLAALAAARPDSKVSELFDQLDHAIDREITDRKFSGLRRRTGVTQ